jgi:hypothetical protein
VPWRGKIAADTDKDHRRYRAFPPRLTANRRRMKLAHIFKSSWSIG